VGPVPAGRDYEEKTIQKLSEKYLGCAYSCGACSGRPRLRDKEEKTQVKLTVKISCETCSSRPRLRENSTYLFYVDALKNNNAV